MRLVFLSFFVFSFWAHAKREVLCPELSRRVAGMQYLMHIAEGTPPTLIAKIDPLRFWQEVDRTVQFMVDNINDPKRGSTSVQYIPRNITDAEYKAYSDIVHREMNAALEARGLNPHKAIACSVIIVHQAEELQEATASWIQQKHRHAGVTAFISGAYVPNKPAFASMVKKQGGYVYSDGGSHAFSRPFFAASDTRVERTDRGRPHAVPISRPPTGGEGPAGGFRLRRHLYRELGER